MLRILVLLELSILVSILVNKRVLLWLLWVIDVDIEVLCDILDIVVLNWLPFLLLLVKLVVTLHVVRYVLVLFVWEELLIVLKISLAVWGIQVWVRELLLQRYVGQGRLFLFRILLHFY